MTILDPKPSLAIPPEPVGSLVIASRNVVLADRVVAATVVIENGEILAIEEDRILPVAEDWGTDLLVPGLVELHTDHLEPH